MRAKDSRENDGFPKLIKRGSFTVKIYRVSNKGRVSFTVVYTSNGKRVLRMFADFEEAHGEARRVANTLEKGEFEVLELCSTDRARYVNAMQALEPTGEAFARLKNFNADEYLKGSFTVFKGSADYEVVVEFDAWAADLILGRPWHASQELVDLPDGCARMRLRLNSIEEIERWILSLGTHATVVRPTALIERLKVSALGIVAKYG